jgi:hypothetical protein
VLDSPQVTQGLKDLLGHLAMPSTPLTEKTVRQLAYRIACQHSAERQGERYLSTMLAHSSVPFVCANLALHWRSAPAISAVRSSIFLSSDKAPPILVVGVGPDMPHGELVKTRLKGALGSILAAIRAARERRPGPCTVVLLSHRGLTNDLEELAHPRIDLVLGGHTHNLAHKIVMFPCGRRTHIVHAGQNGEHLGMLSVRQSVMGALEDVHCSAVKTRPSGWRRSLRPSLDPVATISPAITKLSRPLRMSKKSCRSTLLMRFVADSYLSATRASAAIAYAGQVRRVSSFFKSGQLSLNISE